MHHPSTRSALVCGSDEDLAQAVALHLSAQGIAVALLATAGASAGNLEARTGLPVFSWDVGDYDSCEEGVRRVQKDARLGPLDILVNGAQVLHDCPTRELTQPMWRDVIKVNVGGCFNLVKAVFPSMCERRFGRIISIASAEEATTSLANRAAAAAMPGLIRALGIEGRSAGVTANLIVHDWCIDRERTPCWQQDIADAVGLLCADASGDVTGLTLTMASRRSSR